MRKNKFVALILMLSMVLCSASMLAPVAFAEGETTEPTVWYSENFDDMNSVPSGNYNTESVSASPFLECTLAGCAFSLPERDGGKALKVERTGGQEARVTIHITDHSGAGTKTIGPKVVFSFKINLQTMNTAKVSCHLVEKGSTAWRNVFKIVSGGSIVSGNQLKNAGEGTDMAQLPLKEWSQVSMVVDTETDTFVLYVNGEKCCEDSFANSFGTVSRIFFAWDSGVAGASTVLFDDFCIASDFSTVSARVIGQNIALEDNILVRFYTKFDQVIDANAVNATLTLKAADGSGKKDIVKTYSLLNAPKYDETDETLKGSYYFTIGVPAAMMTDTVTLTVTDACGNELGKWEYSVKTYCDKMIEAGEATGATEAQKKLAVLCESILDYGAAAQTYFGYKTNSLANAGIAG